MPREQASQPEHNSSYQVAAERNKSNSATVPVLQAGEHVLDTMTLAVENGVMGDGEVRPFRAGMFMLN
jgi:hypothetical protein